MKRNRLPFTALIYGGLSLSLLACGGCQSLAVKPDATAAPPVVMATTQQTPLLICLLEDKSGSAGSSRLTPLQERDLKDWLAIVQVRGGALALGFVDEQSDQPLLRVRIAAPPAAPAPPQDANPFIKGQKQTAYDKQLRAYNAEKERWERETEAATGDFLAAAQGRLAAPAKARSSRVNAALARAELFLQEPVWPTGTQRYIVLNSDGQDTTREPPAVIKSGAVILLANGNGELGTLGAQQPAPLRFESLGAALEFVKTAGGR